MAAEDLQLVDEEFNLKDKNVLLPYVRQQIMGNCYAYSVGEAISALFAYVYGDKPVELSTQQITDHVPIMFDYQFKSIKKDDRGCYVSYSRDVLLYANYVGLLEDKNYVKRQNRREEDVQPIPDDKPKFYIGNFRSVYEEGTRQRFRYEEAMTEEQINEILKERPMVGSIKTNKSFHNFDGEGIYMGPNAGEAADGGYHGVLIVGYGVKDGIKYFLIKNSYGTKWGDKGFGKVRRDLLCELAYPLKAIKSNVEPLKLTIRTRIKSRRKRKRNWSRPKTSRSKASRQTQSSFAALRKRSCTKEPPSVMKRKYPEARKILKSVEESVMNEKNSNAEVDDTLDHRAELDRSKRVRRPNSRPSGTIWVRMPNTNRLARLGC